MAARRHTVGKGKKKSCKAALRNLLQYVTSGRRYESKNPYMVDEVKDAIVALDDKTGPYSREEIPHLFEPPKLSAYGKRQEAMLAREGAEFVKQQRGRA